MLVTIIDYAYMRKGLDETTVEKNRSEIVALLKSTQRKGIDKVLQYLDGVGFYHAPSSIDRHHNWYGGLAQHSLGVCRKALAKSAQTDRDSVVIVSLLHDICKAARLYYGSDGRIHRRSLRVRGHGSRSVFLLRREGLELTREERLAIRWHMGTRHAAPDEAADAYDARHSRLWGILRGSDKRDAGEGKRIWY